MRKSLTVLIALLVAVIFVFTAAYAQAPPAAKEKAKQAAEKLDRIHGVVQSINKDASTMNVKERRSGVIRQIVYSDATTVTKVNKPGAKLEDIKEGVRIIALGKFDEKQRLVASRIDIRVQ
jgi:Cu/Ag efflux protein CusF